MEELLNLIRQGKGILFPVKDSKGLTDIYTNPENKYALPQEYAEFLCLTDGLIFNGLEFYGGLSHEREMNSYTFPSIINVNDSYQSLPWSSSVVVIGSFSEDLIVFNRRTQQYEFRDRMTFDMSIRTSSFIDLFRRLIKLQMLEK